MTLCVQDQFRANQSLVNMCAGLSSTGSKLVHLILITAINGLTSSGSWEFPRRRRRPVPERSRIVKCIILIDDETI